MDQAEIAERIRKAQRTGQREALEVLRRLLEQARQRGDESPETLRRAAVTVISLLNRSDESATADEDLVAELRADGRRVAAFNELLRRLVDHEASDALLTAGEALAVVRELEPAVRRADADERRARSAASPSSAPPEAGEEARLRRQRKLAGLGCGALVAIVVALMAFKIWSTHREMKAPSYDILVEGTRVETWDGATLEERRMSVSWANQASDASTRFDLSEGALLWPDAYSEPGQDDIRSWRPRREDSGLEFLVVCSSATRAVGVLVVESFNPGAIVAIDSLPDELRPKLGVGRRERLWEGHLDAVPGARVNLFRLAEPRYLSCVRVVLDTSSAAGYNAIDAVGLLPER